MSDNSKVHTSTEKLDHNLIKEDIRSIVAGISKGFMYRFTLFRYTDEEAIKAHIDNVNQIIADYIHVIDENEDRQINMSAIVGIAHHLGSLDFKAIFDNDESVKCLIFSFHIEPYHPVSENDVLASIEIKLFEKTNSDHGVVLIPISSCTFTPTQIGFDIEDSDIGESLMAEEEPKKDTSFMCCPSKSVH